MYIQRLANLIRANLLMILRIVSRARALKMVRSIWAMSATSAGASATALNLRMRMMISAAKRRVGAGRGGCNMRPPNIPPCINR